MSHYISSFIIEPVVRQARRFSRPIHDYDDELPRPVSDGLASPIHLHHARTQDTDEVMDECENTELGGSNRLASFPPRVLTRHERLTNPHLLHQAERRLRHVVATGDSGLAHAEDQSHLRSGLSTQEPRASGQQQSANASSSSEIDGHTRDLMSHLRHVFHSSRPSSFDRLASSPSATTQVLPEDDGMGALRRKIIAVQTSDRPNDEKSRLVHAFMTERYRAQHAMHSPGSLRSLSASSMRSPDRPVTPGSACSILDPAVTSSPVTSCSLDGEDDIQVSAEDRQPTYHIPPESDLPSRKAAGKQKEELVLGCVHYQRNVKLQCSICVRWYTCRFCHDEAEDHALIRRETRNMLCMLCGVAQPAAQQCRECEGSAAWYYCSICKLWDNNPAKSIYHCDDCGICRVGEGLGKDFFHCKVREPGVSSSPSADSGRPARLVLQWPSGTRIAA